MQRLTDMRILVEDPLSPQGPPDTAIPAFTTMSPNFPALPPPVPGDEELKLTLTRNMAMCVQQRWSGWCYADAGCRRFDALMKTYEQLAEYVLASLRIDTRCRTIHFLDLAMRRVRVVALSFLVPHSVCRVTTALTVPLENQIHTSST